MSCAGSASWNPKWCFFPPFFLCVIQVFEALYAAGAVGPRRQEWTMAPRLALGGSGQGTCTSSSDVTSRDTGGSQRRVRRENEAEERSWVADTLMHEVVPVVPLSSLRFAPNRVAAVVVQRSYEEHQCDDDQNAKHEQALEGRAGPDHRDRLLETKREHEAEKSEAPPQPED